MVAVSRNYEPHKTTKPNHIFPLNILHIKGYSDVVKQINRSINVIFLMVDIQFSRELAWTCVCVCVNGISNDAMKFYYLRWRHHIEWHFIEEFELPQSIFISWTLSHWYTFKNMIVFSPKYSSSRLGVGMHTI